MREISERGGGWAKIALRRAHGMLPSHWLLQDAKARFSELVRRVCREGPQHVTVHGRDEVVVVSAEEFRRLKGERSGDALIAAMQASPSRDIDIDIEPKRDRMPVRGVDLLTGWRLDTNILSGLRRSKPERKGLPFIAARPLERLSASSVIFAEIRCGIELVADASRRAELNDWRAHKLRPMFVERVLPVTEDVMFKWRLLVEEGRKAGQPFSQPDLIIAATALCHG
jgi:prevent-host-death family protein